VHRVQPDAGDGAPGSEPVVQEPEQVAIEGDLRRQPDGNEGRTTADDAEGDGERRQDARAFPSAQVIRCSSSPNSQPAAAAAPKTPHVEVLCQWK